MLVDSFRSARSEGELETQPRRPGGEPGRPLVERGVGIVLVRGEGLVVGGEGPIEDLVAVTRVAVQVVGGDPALNRPGVGGVVDLEVDGSPVLFADLHGVVQIKIGPGGERQPAQVSAALGIEVLTVVVELGRQRQTAPAVGHHADREPEWERVGTVGLEIVGPVLGQRPVQDVAPGVVPHEPPVVVLLDVRSEAAAFVGAGQTGIAALDPAQSIVDPALPIIAEPLFQGDVQAVVFPRRLRAGPVVLAKQPALGDRPGDAITGIGDIELLLQGRAVPDVHTDVLDRPEEVLVDEADRQGEVFHQLLLCAEGDLPLGGRLQVRIDPIERRRKVVDRSGVGVPGLLARGVVERAAFGNLRPIRVLEGVVVLLALPATESELGHVELHDVIVDAEAGEDLQAGIPEHVVDRAHPGSQHLAHVELDGLVRVVRVRGVVRHGRDVLALGPETEIYGQAVPDRPGILEISRPVVAAAVPDASVGGGKGSPDVIVAVCSIIGARRVGADADGEAQARVGPSPVQPDPGMSGSVVDVFVKISIAKARLERMFAQPVHVEGGIHVVADLLDHVLLGLEIIPGGRVAPDVEKIRIGNVEGIVGVFGIGIGEVVGGAVRRQQLLIRLVLPVPAAPVGDEQGVADGIIRGQRGGPVGIIHPFLVPFVVSVIVADDIRDGPPILGEIVQEAGRKTKPGQGSGRELDGPAVVVVLFPEPGEGSVPQVEIPQRRRSIVGRVDGAEEPQPVPDDAAAEAEDPFEPIVIIPVFPAVEIQVVVVHVFVEVIVERVLPEIVPCAPPHPRRVVLVEAHEVAVKLVAPGPGDDVDDATHRAAVLGIVARGRDLDLVQQLENDVLTLDSQMEVRHVRPVDEEYVLGPRGPVDRNPPGDAFGLDPGNGADERVERPPPGQGHVDFLGHDLTLGRALDVDKGGLADDRDPFLDGGLFQGHVHGQGLGQLQVDALPDQRLESGKRKNDLVGSGRKGHQTKCAVAVGDRGGFPDQPGARGFDIHAGKGNPLVIDDPPGDLPFRRELGESRSRGQKPNDERKT